MHGPISTYACRIQKLLNQCFPAIAIVLGSGFNILVKQIKDAVCLQYKDIDIAGFPVSTVKGHNGRFVAGTLNGKRVVVMDGRVHLYEGFSVDQVVFPLRMLMAAGCKTVILTSAVGGINRNYKPGDIVLVRDHLCLDKDARPMYGKRDSEVGKRFQDMCEVYDAPMRHLARVVALRLDEAEDNQPKIGQLPEGKLFFMPGPDFETPAEVDMIDNLGADMVGMSISEAIAAHLMGAQLLSIACVVNMAAGIEPGEISHEGTMKAMTSGGERAARLIAEIVGDLPHPT